MKWLYENEDEQKIIRESREAFQRAEGIAERMGRTSGRELSFFGTPEKELIRHAAFAQASAVLVGRKFLFHDAYGFDDAAFLSDVFKEAWSEQHPSLRFHYDPEGGHVLLWRDDLLEITTDELVAISGVDATNGNLLGYGSQSYDPTALTVLIKDEHGNIWGGFTNGNADWETFAQERTRDFTYATGKKLGYTRN